MTEPELRQLADAAAQVLRPHLERSEPLRRAVALIGKWLCAEAADAAPGAPACPAPTGAIGAPGAADLQAGTEPEPAPPAPRADGEATARHGAAGRAPVEASAVVPLRLGDGKADLVLTGTAEDLARARASVSEGPVASNTETSGMSVADLGLIEARCRLKAASCRLFIERRAAPADSEAERDVLDRLNGMIAKARSLPNCFLWALYRDRQQPDDALLARIADCYDAQADAVALMRRVAAMRGSAHPDDERSGFLLLAAANSALRVALDGTWLTEDDRDQTEVHVWLRRETAARRVYVERHMTIDDPADPAGAAERRLRIQAEAQRLAEREAAARRVKSVLGQVRYHSGQLAKCRPGDAATHWSKIADAVAQLGTLGVPPTDRRIAEAVGPVAAGLWPGLTPGADHLAAVIPRASALARDPEATTMDATGPDRREWSDTVLSVRDLLRGRRMVIVGGERNPEAIRRLVQAFELKDAEWVELMEHGTGGPMRAPVARPDTAVVVVIVKLTGHLHADEARKLAVAAGKPFVMLPGGYNPERVADAIGTQASDRLRMLVGEQWASAGTRA